MFLYQQSGKLIAAITLLLISQLGFSQWVRINQNQGSFAKGDVRDMHLYDSTNGYVAASDGLYFTRSEGKPFADLKYTGMDADIQFAFRATQVYAADKSNIVVAGYYGTEAMILWTDNEGANWQLGYYEEPEGNEFWVGVGTMQFLSREIGLVTTKNGILRTSDGGKSWAYVHKKIDAIFDHLYFVNATHGWAGSDEGLYRTINGGKTWTNISSKQSYSFHFINETTGFLSGREEEGVFKTVNGGVNWVKVNHPLHSNARKLFFLNDSVGFCSKNSDYLYKTSSGGKYWEEMPTAYGNDIDFRFIKQFGTSVYTAGDRFTILRTKNDGGPIEPRIGFSIDQSTICTKGRTSLVNESPSYHQTEWWVNGKFLTDSFNASYETVSNRRDTITKIIIYNGERYPQTQYVLIPELAPPNLSIEPNRLIFCRGDIYEFRLVNTTANATYRLYLNGTLTSTLTGNGRNILFRDQFGRLGDSVLVEVVGSSGGLCKTQEVKQNFWVMHRKYNTNLHLSATTDTICSTSPTEITIHNSQIGYNYYYDTTFQKPVPGNGGIIKVIFQENKRYIRRDDSIGIVSIPVVIKIKEAVRGCYWEESSTTVTLTARVAQITAELGQRHQYAGLPQPYELNAVNAQKSLWYSDSAGVINNYDTTKNARFLSFATPGLKNIVYKIESKEGCVDSCVVPVEIISESNLPAAVPSDFCTVDTFQLPYNLRVREIEFDRYGNRYIAGTVTTVFQENYVHVSSYEIRKIKPDGTTAWVVSRKADSRQNSYCITEKIVVDKYENVYVLGYSPPGNKFPIESVNKTVSRTSPTEGLFLMKINRSGNIVWVRTLRNHDYVDETGSGGIFMGKNDDLFLLVNAHAGVEFNFVNTSIEIAGKGFQTILLHIDQHFNLLDYRRYDGQQSGIISNWRASSGVRQDKLEPGFWTSNGEIATLISIPYLNESDESFDDTPSNVAGYVSYALAFYDTAAKKITRRLPFYTIHGTKWEKYIPRVYCIDSVGNYYGVECRQYNDTFPGLGFFHTKYQVTESFLIKYNSNGNIVWRKRMTQFAPDGIGIVNNRLFLWGTTFITEIPDIPRGNPEPGITSFENSPDEIVGKRGIDGSDIVGMFVSLDGEVEKLTVMGSNDDDYTGRARVDRFGNCWVTGTARNTKLGNVAAVDSYVNFIASFNLSGSCINDTISSEKYLQLQTNTLPVSCIDSSFTLRWSSNLSGPATLSFSIDEGQNFVDYSAKVELSNDSLQFTHEDLSGELSAASGNILVKLEHDATGKQDQQKFFIEATPPPLLLDDSLLLCAFDEVKLNISPNQGHRFIWYDWNGQDSTSLERIITRRNLNWLYINHISPAGCYDFRRLQVQWIGTLSTSEIDTTQLRFQNRLVATLDFSGRYYWYRDGVLLPDSGRILQNPAPGYYSLRLRDHYTSPCFSPYSQIVQVKTTITSLDEIDPAELGYVLFPNPLVGNLSVKFSVEESSAVVWQVLDIHGRVAYQEDWGKVFRGLHQKQVAGLGSLLKKGTYFCQLILNNKGQSVKTLIIP